MSKDGPTRSKTRLEAHLRFFKNEPIDAMTAYVFYFIKNIIIKKLIKDKFPQKNVKFPRINMKIGKNGISPFFT